jgi:hypothetical protein
VGHHGHLDDVADAAVAPLLAEPREAVAPCAAVLGGVPGPRRPPGPEPVLDLLRAVDEAALGPVLEEVEALVRRHGALAVVEALLVVAARGRLAAVGADQGDVPAAHCEADGVPGRRLHRHVVLERAVDEAPRQTRARASPWLRVGWSWVGEILSLYNPQLCGRIELGGRVGRARGRGRIAVTGGAVAEAIKTATHSTLGASGGQDPTS